MYLEKSLEEFVLEYADYTERIITNYAKLIGINKDELLSYAYEGLISAYNNYDEKKGSDILSYIYKCIKSKVLSGLPEIRGYGNKSAYYQYRKESKELAESQEKLDTRDDHLSEEMKNYKLLHNPIHLEETYGNCDLTYLEKLSESEEEESYYRDLKTHLFEALEVLTDKEKFVIIKRYGLDDQGMKTYYDIGKEMEIPKLNIRKIEMNALRKLRHPRVCTYLKEYLDSDCRMNGENPSTVVGRSIS